MFPGSSSSSCLGGRQALTVFTLTENTHACRNVKTQEDKNVPHTEEQGPSLSLGVVAGREAAIHVR